MSSRRGQRSPECEVIIHLGSSKTLANHLKEQKQSHQLAQLALTDELGGVV